LLAKGFVKGKSDSTMFVHSTTHTKTIVLVYVDDIIIIDNNDNEIKNLKTYLKDTFDIKDLGKLRYFLGIEITHSNKGLFYLKGNIH
jgi:Reverse transcriptase (RNA-dependent DNA polymerase)